MSLTVPVTFIIFNRPEKTEAVFNEIAKAEPEKLFIIADGPRFSSEEKKCLQCRSIVEKVDWNCTVERNYSPINMGCKRRISSGLDWVFNQSESSIILEDDCLPHPSFFEFCEDLLIKYRDDKRIMHISGDYFLLDNKEKRYSYYFSKYPHVWGWATWKRAWQSYDVNIKLWKDSEVRKAILDYFPDTHVKSFWLEIFNLLVNGQIDTWDYQWAFNCFINNGLAINPSTNLVSNIGFDSNATHTNFKNGLSNLSVNESNFPLCHPPYILPNKLKDRFIEKKFFYKPSRIQIAINKIKGF